MFVKIKLAVVLSCLILSEVSPARSRQSAEEEIIRFVEKYDNAWNHKDAAVIERILAPDYVYFTSKGEVRSRQALIDELLSPKYTLVSAERTELKIYLASATAVVGSRWKGQGMYDGLEFHDNQRCSIVLAREKREWRVLSEHCTQITAR